MAGPRFFGFVIGGSLPVSARRQLARHGLGPEHRRSTRHAGHRRARSRSRCAGCWTCSACRRLAPAPSSPAPRWPTSPRWPRRATACSRAPAGTSRPTACSARRRSPCSSARRCIPTLLKALGLLGLGRNRVTRVPVDGQGRMRADALPPIAGPTIVCAQAGNLNTGAFDPFGEICDRGRRPPAPGCTWMAPSACGRAAAPALAHLAAGSQLADSWATDAPQVAQRALRQRPRLRARRRRAARRDGRHRRLPADRQRRAQSRRTTRRSCRGARAASRSGPRCARWGAAASPT